MCLLLAAPVAATAQAALMQPNRPTSVELPRPPASGPLVHPGWVIEVRGLRHAVRSGDRVYAVAGRELKVVDLVAEDVVQTVSLPGSALRVEASDEALRVLLVDAGDWWAATLDPRTLAVLSLESAAPPQPGPRRRALDSVPAGQGQFVLFPEAIVELNAAGSQVAVTPLPGRPLSGPDHHLVSAGPDGFVVAIANVGVSLIE